MQQNRQQNGTFVVLVIDTLGCRYTHAQTTSHKTATSPPYFINRNTNTGTAKGATLFHAMYQDTEDTYRRSAGPLWSAAGKYQGRCTLRSKRADISYLKRSEPSLRELFKEMLNNFLPLQKNGFSLSMRLLPPPSAGPGSRSRPVQLDGERAERDSRYLSRLINVRLRA